jgi:hypothetical protein
MFFGLPDPVPYPLVRAMDQDPTNIKKNINKCIDSYYFQTLSDLLSLKNDVNLPSKNNTTLK